MRGLVVVGGVFMRERNTSVGKAEKDAEDVMLPVWKRTSTRCSVDTHLSQHGISPLSVRDAEMRRVVRTGET